MRISRSSAKKMEEQATKDGTAFTDTRSNPDGGSYVIKTAAAMALTADGKQREGIDVETDQERDF